MPPTVKGSPDQQLSSTRHFLRELNRFGITSTIVGGKIVWSSAEFEGLAAPLPAPAPAWSPVTEFGGFRDPTRGVR
jgi:hypothetical protein